jgi:hypothetical protein
MSTLKETGGEAETPAKKAPGAAKGKKAGAKAQKASKAGIVDAMIDEFNEKFRSGEVKFSVADFIRLVQLRQGLDEEEPTEVRVTWVEPDETESANET